MFLYCRLLFLKKMVIKKLVLDHKGGFYFYRAHQSKIDKLCSNGFSVLKDYIEDMFWNCPNKYFQDGPRGSKLKFKLNSSLNQLSGHEMSLLASMGLTNYKDRYKTNHSKVQVFMLENDDKTIAVEVPVWIYGKELNGINSETITGHIDVLRIENDKVWIWDYKPKAIEEKYAATQTYFYSLMLSKRTGIDLDNFRCGYFDDRHAFVFDPSKVNLKNESLVSF